MPQAPEGRGGWPIGRTWLLVGAMAALEHLVVLDFEATCNGDEPPDPQEIIEFPSVLMDARSFEILDEREAFVRPVHHPTLTPFCTELTGIAQSDVDGAPTFDEVYAAQRDWLRSHRLGMDGERWAYVTSGDWDLRTMLPAQLATAGHDHVPPAYRRWINIKEPFRTWSPKLRRAGMVRMLEALELELEGRHHRGIDDSRNIARIVRALAARGQPIEITTELPASRYPTIGVTLVRNQKTAEVQLRKRAVATLLGLASEAFRRGARELFEGDRPLTCDADLRDLRSGAVIRVD